MSGAPYVKPFADAWREMDRAIQDAKERRWREAFEMTPEEAEDVAQRPLEIRRIDRTHFLTRY
jgi:hypothetical protein